MRDPECVDFLQWALPRLHLRFRGYRRVRGQVCKRITRRLRELGLPDAAAYRHHLAERPEEWRVLDGLCHVTISRFYRDRGVFDALCDSVLPELAERAAARGEASLRAWSAGCASGEEAYTLKAAWELGLRRRHPGLTLALHASDADAGMLARARRARFRASSLRDLPAAWQAALFEHRDGDFAVRREFRAGIDFRCEDLRDALPDGPFHLILCRNLAFTYFDGALQRRSAAALAARLVPHGALVIGVHEALPEGAAGLRPWGVAPGIFRRSEAEERPPEESRTTR